MTRARRLAAALGLVAALVAVPLGGRWQGQAHAASPTLPAITTREAGDVIRDEIEGIIVQPGNVDAIASAIRRLYDNADLVERMSRAARERVVENFTWEHYRKRLLTAYETALKA